MSAKNRGDRISLLHKVVTKHFTPVAAPDDRTVLEHLAYACCLENATYEAADEAFHRLRESFFDWNEIRVTTISELCDALHNLPDASSAAVRIKKNLQSLFETRYSFDIDDMVKMNLGKATQELEKLGGMTRFVLGYTTQNALGGHSIPVSKSVMEVLLATEIVSESEATKGLAPGLERTVPKTKGAAFGSCLHQLAVQNANSPDDKSVLAIMKEAGAKPPKKPAAKKPAAKTVASKTSDKAAAAESPKTDKPEPAASKPAPTKKKVAETESTKKPAKKKTSPSKKAAPSSTKKISKKKPR